MVAFLLGWYFVAMWFLRRQHPVREQGVLVYYPILAFVFLGVITDCVFNWTFGSILFMDVPRVWKGELTLSQRMHRIRKTGTGWRLMIADYVCERLLNPRDPDGHHC
jgi:hypothetical protein